ncbi:MAG: DUF799 domain-containing protein [Prevotellaceae bacterium]|nr:DUF799 domain-containing protein [Prevotellaceae bacterium]
MKKNLKIAVLLLSVFSMAFFNNSCSKNLYLSGNFRAYSQNHRTVAIVPPIIAYNSARVGIAGYASSEEINRESLNLQNELYNRLLIQTTAKKPVLINFQDIAVTNDLLKQNGLTADNLRNVSIADLLKILKADAILITRVDKEMIINEKASELYKIGKAAAEIIGKKTVGNSAESMSMGKVKINSSLYNFQNSELLWKTWNEYNISVNQSTEIIFSKYTTGCSKGFPYRD